MGGRKRQLSLQIEAEGRSFDFSDQTLVLECKAEPTIKLYFLRFGVLTEKPEESHLRAKIRIEGDKPQKDKDGNIALDEVIVTSTKLENFSTVRTGLNPGYIYIIDENKPNEPIEFEVDEYGNFKSISWEKGGEGFPDIRVTDGKNNTSGFYEAEYESVVWAAYSPIQWTKAYYDSLVSDSGKRKERMTQIQASGFPLETVQSTTDHAPYTGITTYFSSDKRSLCRSVQQKIDTVQRQEEKRQKNRDENPDHQEPEIMTDMFVTLDDPVGSAEVIASVLGEKILEFKALVEAIQTGETQQAALERLKNNCTPASSVDKNYQNLFSLALACYKMVYSSKENTQKYDGGKAGWNFNDTNFPHQDQPTAYKTSRGTRYRYPSGYVPNEFIGYGLHRKKVENILGVAARKEKRELVNSFRKDYGNFIKSNYFKKGLENYTENIPQRVLAGVARLHIQILPFFNNPYNIDRHLLLQDDYKEEDNWTNWLIKKIENDVVDTSDSLDILLKQEVTLADTLFQSDAAIDLSNKFAAATYARIEIHTHIAFKAKTISAGTTQTESYQKILKEKHERIVKSLNKIQISNSKSGVVEKVFKYGNTNMIEMDASLLGATFDPNLEIVVTDTNKQVEKIVADKFKHQRIYGQRSMAAGGNHVLEIGDEVENISRNEFRINEGNAKRFNQKAADFLNSRGFNGVLTGLQVLNFSNAVLNLFTESDTKHKLAKNLVNSFGIGAELTDVSLKLTQAHYNAIGNTLSANKLISKIRIAGAIGGAVTSAMCIWDGVLALNKRDTDAGAAWIGAGVAFGVSTAAAIWGSSVAILAGPVGWIALAVGFGLVALANIFTDSELEYYFKNFLLSDREAFDLRNGETPMQYNRRLFASKHTLVDYDDKDIREKLMNPTDAMASLFDLTVCNNIAYKPTDLSPRVGNGHAAYRLINTYEIRINFNQFLQDKNQAEIVLLLLDDTVLESGDPSVYYPKTTNKIEKLATGQHQLISSIQIPETLTKTRSYWYKVVIAVRLNIDDSINRHFPYPLQHQGERYMGARLSLKRGMHGRGSGEKELKFGPLHYLKNHDTW